MSGRDLEKILSPDPLPGMTDPVEENDNFRDRLYRSARLKEDILTLILKEGGLETLRDYMGVDCMDTDPDYFTRIGKKSDFVLRAIDRLSLQLPTTSYSQVQMETTIKKADVELQPPRHISKEELMQANILYLEGKEEERAFKKKAQEKAATLEQTIDIQVEARK